MAFPLMPSQGQSSLPWVSTWAGQEVGKGRLCLVWALPWGAVDYKLVWDPPHWNSSFCPAEEQGSFMGGVYPTPRPGGAQALELGGF